MKTYFIQAASGPVKIGKANSVRTRLATLSCSSYETLSVLGVIEGDEEKQLHRRFKASRIRREWFRPSKSLLAFIAENASPVDFELADDLEHDLGPGTFVRFDRETREWLSAKAKTDDRSVSSMLRKIVADAKLADSTVEREPATVSSAA